MAARTHRYSLPLMKKDKPNAEKQPFPGQQSHLQKKAPQKFSVSSTYRQGSGAERFREYMIKKKIRPMDNDIQFWRNLVAEFFAPSSTMRWCMSSYKGIKEIDNIPKVAWQCNICISKPCCGFEISEELLPRLHKIKYDGGVLKENLHIDTLQEYQGECGKIFLHFKKAIEETEYNQARILRHGQLRVVFSPDLKICSWEFCARSHKEYIDRTSIIPQAHQLQAAMQNYWHSAQYSFSVTPEELQKRGDLLISSASQMVEALGMPLINQIGMTKRYVESLQVSEVLNVMHDLIDYSQEHGLPPKESMANLIRHGTSVSSGKYFDHQYEQHQSPATFSASHLESCAGAGRASGSYGNGLGGMTTSSSMQPNNFKRQCTWPSSSHAQTQAQTTPISFSTPLFNIQPQVAHIAIGKSGTESAAANVQTEPNISAPTQQPNHSILDDPDSGLSSVERIIREVMGAQPHNIVGNVSAHGNAENKKGNMATSSNVFGNNTIGGDSVASTLRSQMDVDIFPKDAKENYLPTEYSDQLNNEFLEFGLHELL